MFAKFDNFDTSNKDSLSYRVLMDFAQKQVEKYDKNAKIVSVNAGAEVFCNDPNPSYSLGNYNIEFEIVALTSEGYERTAYSTFNEFIEFLVEYDSH